MTEIWKDITNYEDNYQISNLGNVRSKDRTIYRVDGRKKTISGQPMKLSVDIHGYYKVNLRKNNKLNTARVHKLVANHFLKREMGKNIVNHKDGNKLNNYVDNLEFVTLSENTLHAIYTLKKDFTKTKLEKKQPIISIENNEIYRFFESISKAVKFYNISSRTIGRKLNNPKNDLYFIRFSDLNDDNINKIVNKQDILDIKYNIKRRNK